MIDDKSALESLVLPRRFLRQCRRAGRRTKVVDSTGAKLSGTSLLMRTLILRRLFLREILCDDELYVGLLLPPSAAAVVANVATALCGRTAVNLNYTVTSEILNDCIGQCGIRHVVTSRRFMEKMDFQIDCDVVYLEDLRERVRVCDKLLAAWGACATPIGSLERKFGLDQIDPDDVMTVIFTSGSTGQPKGVMLSYGNVASNVDAINAVVPLTEQDAIAAFLPFFHSFGFTITLWTVLSLSPKGVYHYSPLDAKVIGRLCEQHNTTIMLSTPTFLRSYLKRCTAEQFKSLDVVVAGAEKLPIDLCEAFEEKFGVRPVEGYGTTELSPLASVNIPPSRSRSGGIVDLREGSVGRPIPGVEARIVDPDSSEPLPTGKAGMLWIKGPNVMQGYLHQEQKTAEVIRDGWYVTGDIGLLDEDGFIFITGRQSRFSKIGGEMVPHIQIEELIERIVSDDPERLHVAVTAVPDEKKGERLIVLHATIEKTPDEIRKTLAAEGLPNIYIPSADSFLQVDEIPILGTGKLDLKAIKDIAMEKFGPK